MSMSTEPKISEAIWITWHDHQRTASIASQLDLPVVVRDVSPVLSRHVGGFLWTLRQLCARQPTFVFVHVSYMLLLACLIYKWTHPTKEVRLICDCHNKALKRTTRGPSRWPFEVFKKSILSKPDLVIVSNQLIAEYAKLYSPRVEVLRDPLPCFSDLERQPKFSNMSQPATGVPGRKYVVFVCSFDTDEPLRTIFEAAEMAVQELGTAVVITGDYRKGNMPRGFDVSTHIRLPGFLPRHEYVQLLRDSESMIVLTNDRDCLLCGAYEALAIGKPLVISDTTALRSCFGESAEYTLHTDSDVVCAIQRALERSSNAGCTTGAETFRKAFSTEWDRFVNRLQMLGFARNPQSDSMSGSKYERVNA